MRLALLVLVLAGCVAAPAAPHRPPPAPAPAGPLGPIAWFPAGSRHIARQLPGAISRLDWFAALSRARDHACWAELEAGIDRAYTVRRRGADPAPVLVLHGRLERARVEACVEAHLGLASAAPLRLRLDRDGDVTHVVTRLGDVHVGWLDDRWMVISGKVSRVRDFLDRDGTLADDAAMAALLERVDDTAPVWAVVGDGYADPLIGVPTRGVVASGSFGPPRFALTVLCADAETARVAAEAIGAGRLRAEIPEALRPAMQRLAPRADGAALRGEVELTLGEVDLVLDLIARSR